MADISIAELNKTLKDENTKKLKADREDAEKQRNKDMKRELRAAQKADF